MEFLPDSGVIIAVNRRNHEQTTRNLSAQAIHFYNRVASFNHAIHQSREVSALRGIGCFESANPRWQIQLQSFPTHNRPISDSVARKSLTQETHRARCYKSNGCERNGRFRHHK